MNKLDFGVSVKAFRKKAGLSRSELAKKVGVTYHSIYNLEESCQMDMKLSTAIGLCDIFKITIDEFVNLREI